MLQDRQYEVIGCQKCAICGYKIPCMEYMRKWYRAKIRSNHEEKIYLTMEPIIIHFTNTEIAKIICVCGGSEWKQYVYAPQTINYSVYSANCLADIQHFLGQLECNTVLERK